MPAPGGIVVKSVAIRAYSGRSDDTRRKCFDLARLVHSPNTPSIPAPRRRAQPQLETSARRVNP